MVIGLYQDGQVVGAGVDYVSATTQIGRRARTLRRIGEGTVATAISSGERERPWAAWGYSGVAAGGAAVGSGDAGTIVRVSGARAASVCREIIANADKVSRIDLQATIRFNRDVGALARRSGEELQRNQRERKRRLRARVERTFGRGDTLYVGSRASQWFGRVYDKYRESGDEAFLRCWRYEVECKEDAAEKATRFLASVGYGSAEIAGAVGNWFRSRGITPRYRSTVDGAMGPIGAADTDAARQLRWLSGQVGPVARRLASVYSEGDVVAVLFGRTDPSTLIPTAVEVDDDLAAYDDWALAIGESTEAISAKHTEEG